jgi:WD40 repeat protein
VGCYFDPKKNNLNDLVQIFAFNDTKKDYVLISNLLNGHTDTVTDVEWAPQFGRSFHLIATSSLDKSIIIWKVDLKYDFNNDHYDNISVKYENIFTHKHDSQVKSINFIKIRFGDYLGIFQELYYLLLMIMVKYWFSKK